MQSLPQRSCPHLDVVILEERGPAVLPQAQDHAHVQHLPAGRPDAFQ